MGESAHNLKPSNWYPHSQHILKGTFKIAEMDSYIIVRTAKLDVPNLPISTNHYQWNNFTAKNITMTARTTPITKT